MHRRRSSGWLLAIWIVLLASCGEPAEPTPLSVGPDQIAALQQLRAERKFAPYERDFYPGAPNEAIRARCQAAVDDLLDVLARDLTTHPTKEYVLGEFRRTLTRFDLEDSEERDRAGGYLEQTMDIVGIEGSDGLLEEWRYGFAATRE